MPGPPRRCYRLRVGGWLVVLMVVGALQAACGAIQPPRYVFLLIGDGLGDVQAEAAESALACSPGDQLLFQTFPVRGWQRTRSASDRVTDSPAAATAMACGVRTDNPKVGLAPDGTPLCSIAWRAHRRGRKVGILSDIGIDHATPAAFYARVGHRKQYAAIAAQMAACPFAFMGGSAMIGLQPETPSDLDPQALAVANGFTLVTNRAGLAQIQTGQRIFAHQSPSPRDRRALPWAIHATSNDLTLAEFASAAIRHLQDAPFFIMIEGGQIDYACHANDLGTMVREVERFNDMLRVCLDFARQHTDQTLIVVTGDHETGGLKPVWRSKGDPRRVLRQRHPGEWIVARLQPLVERQGPFSEAADELDAALGELAFTPKQRRQLEVLWRRTLNGRGQPSERALAFTIEAGRRYVANAGYRFTTQVHTRRDVPVYAFGIGADRISGTYDNTGIFDRLLNVMHPDVRSSEK